MAAGNVLFVTTSYHGVLGDSPTGCWVEEVSTPYYSLKANGIHVDIISIEGGTIPFDPASETSPYLTQSAETFLNSKETADLLHNTKSIQEMHIDHLDSYDALFIPGGHGIMFDAEKLQNTIQYMWKGGKIIASVCHGPAALLYPVDDQGEYLIKNKRVTGFSNSEEVAVKKDTIVPFSLENELKARGALYEKGNDWTSHVVTHGKLITGQNPASSLEVAKQLALQINPGIPIQHGKGEGFHHRATMYTDEHHHDHRDDHPGQGKRHDVSEHPQAHMSQWHSPVRQTSHTGPGQAKSRHSRPDKSYVG